MRGYLRLSRPGNVVMSAVGVAIAALVAVGPQLFVERIASVALAGVSAMLFTAAGNALNDYSDRDTDRVNHPDRPIPRGDVSAEAALRFASLGFALSLAIAYAVNLIAVLVVVANFVLMVAYEKLFKSRGASGNALVSYLVGSLFLFGGVAVYPGAPSALPRTIVLAILAALATAGRELVKDIEDVRGDVDRATLPRRIGVRNAGVAAGALFVACVSLSAAPYLISVLGPVYLGIVILADIMFIYAGVYSARTPGRAQRIAKYGMVVALIAFLAGGLVA